MVPHPVETRRTAGDAETTSHNRFRQLHGQRKPDSMPAKSEDARSTMITGIHCPNLQPVKMNAKQCDRDPVDSKYILGHVYNYEYTSPGGELVNHNNWSDFLPPKESANAGGNRRGSFCDHCYVSEHYSDYLPGSFIKDALGAAFHFPAEQPISELLDLPDGPLSDDVWLNESATHPRVLESNAERMFLSGSGEGSTLFPSAEFSYLSRSNDGVKAKELFYESAFFGFPPDEGIKDPHEELRGRHTPSTNADCSNRSVSLSPSSAISRHKIIPEIKVPRAPNPANKPPHVCCRDKELSNDKFINPAPPAPDERMMVRAGANDHCRRTPVKGWWKTDMCKFWTESHGCRNGVNCRWAHGLSELRNTNVAESRVTPPIASPFLLSAAVAAKVQGAAAKQSEREELNRASGREEWRKSGSRESDNKSMSKCRDANRLQANSTYAMSFSSRMSDSLDWKVLSMFYWIVRPADEAEVLKNPNSLMMLWNHIRDQEVKPMKLPSLNFPLEFWKELSDAWCPFVLSETWCGDDHDNTPSKLETCGLCSGVFFFVPTEGSAHNCKPFCPVCPECRDMMISHMQESRLAKFWNVEMWNLGVSPSSCPWQPYLLEYIRSIDVLYMPKHPDKKYNYQPRTHKQLCFNRLSFALNLLCNQLPTAERTLFMTSLVTPKLPLLNWAVFSCHPLLFTVLLRNAFPIPLAALPALLKDELKCACRQSCGDAARSDNRPRFPERPAEPERMVPAPPLITPY